MMSDLLPLPHGAQAIPRASAIIDNVAKAFKPILGADLKKMSRFRGRAGGSCLDRRSPLRRAARGTAPGLAGRLWTWTDSQPNFGRKSSIVNY
jgi:hypothetical protein